MFPQLLEVQREARWASPPVPRLHGSQQEAHSRMLGGRLPRHHLPGRGLRLGDVISSGSFWRLWGESERTLGLRSLLTSTDYRTCSCRRTAGGCTLAERLQSRAWDACAATAQAPEAGQRPSAVCTLASRELSEAEAVGRTWK